MKYRMIGLLIVFVLIALFIFLNVNSYFCETDYSKETEVQLEVEIPEEEIIEIFNDNSSTFTTIAEDLLNRKENIMIEKLNGRFTIRDAWNDYDMSDFESNEELLFLLDNLKFITVYESDEFIEFGKDGDYGIVYKKKDPIYYTEIVLIQDNWYFYIQIHN